MSFAHRRWFPATLALLLLLAFGCATAGEPAVKPPTSPAFLWVVTREGQPGTVFLAGTIHLRKAEEAMLDRALLDALDAADELVLEIAPDASSAQRTADAVAKLGYYPPGKSLLDDVDADTRVALLAAARQVGLPREALSRLRPWLASLTLSVMRMQAQGFSEEAGVESLLLERVALSGGKQTASLETIEEQLQLFSGFPHEAQLQMLRETVEQFEENDRMLERMQSAFARGDEDELSAIIFKSRGESDLAEALHRATFDERNTRMVERIEPWFSKDQKTVVAVGVGHLLGEMGIPAMLVRRGFRVRAVDAQGPAPVRPAHAPPPGAFHDPALGFSARFPRKPQVSRQQMPTPQGHMAQVVVVSAKMAGAELAVIVNELPDAHGEDSDHSDKHGHGQRSNFEAVSAMLAHQFGAIEQEERITVQGHPAMRFIANADGTRVSCLAVVTGTRLFLALSSRASDAPGGAARESDDMGREFLDSFTLLQQGSPAE